MVSGQFLHVLLGLPLQLLHVESLVLRVLEVVEIMILLELSLVNGLCLTRLDVERPRFEAFLSLCGQHGLKFGGVSRQKLPTHT